ncbi:MAG: hypothetical protein HY717_10175 [Planctomycetes bacterium]|nr:hypothetical protein [Planctomycetota bacterium]
MPPRPISRTMRYSPSRSRGFRSCRFSPAAVLPVSSSAKLARRASSTKQSDGKSSRIRRATAGARSANSLTEGFSPRRQRAMKDSASASICASRESAEEASSVAIGVFQCLKSQAIRLGRFDLNKV